MPEDDNAEILKWRTVCAELEEQVKLLVKTELKLRRTQAELVDSKKKVEVANRTLEEKVRERTEELERKNAELFAFAYVASHDLKEPLRKISVFGGRLSETYREALDERGREFLERINAAAARMQHLIDDLLAYTRVTIGAEPYSIVALSRILEDVLADLEVAIEKADASVTAEPLPAVAADPIQMRQLFQNLLSNALKFRAPGRPPVIRVSPAEPPCNGFCGIVFEDNGIGIDPKHFERIFGVFQRLHTRDDYEGSGIGLAICKKIAERHGGSISVESAQGKGAKFTVYLPKTQKEYAPPPPP